MSRAVFKILSILFNLLTTDRSGNAIAGDIEEEYSELNKRKGSVSSLIWLIKITCRTLTALLYHSFNWRMVMFFNYLKTALRVLGRRKLYSSINIIGLTLGLTISGAIFLWAGAELSYDKFNRNHKDIYRVVLKNPADPDSYAGTPSPLASKLKEMNPEIIRTARIQPYSGTLKIDNKNFFQKNIFYADPDFTEIFTLKLLNNIEKSKLTEPDSIMLSESTAGKLFGKKNPLGQTIEFKKKTWKVTAVYRDFPVASHIHPSVLISFEQFNYARNWGAWNYHCYIQLSKGTHPDKISLQPEELKETRSPLHLQPLTDIHFQYNRANIEPATEYKYLTILGSAALIILLLACINYINLSTVMLQKRAQELGIRKAIGAGRMQLIAQFAGETFLVTTIAGILGFILLAVSVPLAGSASGTRLPDPLNIDFITSYLLTIICVSLITGIYPAIMASARSSVLIKKHNPGLMSSANLRKILLIVQFGILSLLISSASIISSQLNFIDNYDLGLDTRNVINIPLRKNSTIQKRWIIKDALKNIQGVEAVSFNSYNPLNMNWNQFFRWTGMPPESNSSAWVIFADRDFCRTMSIEMVKGTDRTGLVNDRIKEAYVMNSAALKLTGWKNSDGKKVTIFSNNELAPVIGICRDFNFRSLRHEVAPLLLIFQEKRIGSSPRLSIKIEKGKTLSVIDSIKRRWKTLNIDENPEIAYLSETFDYLYSSEINTKRILNVFTFVAVIIAVFGLFTLASYIIERKLKEIAIRKVMGASIKSIALKIGSGFMPLIGTALVISLPFAHYYTSLWLQTFTYRIDMSILPYLLSVVTCIILAIFTVSFHVIRAGKVNPSVILSSE